MTDREADGRIQIIEHTADWSLRVRGRDLEQLFRHAAEGMAGLLAGDAQATDSPDKRSVNLTSYDTEGLLVDWLSELAYWAERDGFVFRDFRVSELTSTTLAAMVHGAHVPELQKHIKAVTYHNLEIRRTGDDLEVTIVFDV